MTEKLDSMFPEGYKAPTGDSQFMKLKDGDNKFRVLTPAVIGWEGWRNNKPFRVPFVIGQDCPIKDDEVDFDQTYGKPKINHFWAFTIWNYGEKKVQVLEITQKTIMRAIENYYIVEDWGDPRYYDLNIKRDKVGDKISYSVIPTPPKPLSKEATEAFESSKVDLSKLFSGEYPMGNPTTDSTGIEQPPF